MSFNFICVLCQNIIEIDYLKKDFTEKEIVNLVKPILKQQVCVNCYGRFMKPYKERSEKLSEEINELTDMHNSLHKEISSPHFREIIAIQPDELELPLQESQKKFNNLVKEGDELEKELDKLIKELGDLTKKEENLINQFNQEENNTLIVNKEFYRLQNTLNMNQNIQNDMMNNANNIFDDLFVIQINDQYGAINGCRMFIIPNQILYNEISRGWGHIVFLTNILVDKLLKLTPNKHKFDYTLYPLGNFSYIENNKYIKRYLLYFTDESDIPIINEGMIEYLNILNFLYVVVMGINPNFISEDFQIYEKGINSYPITIESNTIENCNDWNNCIKCLLLMLKMYMSAVLKIENEKIKLIVDKSENIWNI